MKLKLKKILIFFITVSLFVLYSDCNNDSSENQINVKITKLTGTNIWSYDHFGKSVCISDKFAIVGADTSNGGYQDSNPSTGSAYIFERQHNKEWLEKAKLEASNKSEFSFFGKSVSINYHYAIVGSGANYAYIFEREENGYWIEKTILQPIDIQDDDNFGYSVAIEGNYAIVGAYNISTKVGSAYIFERQDDGTWVEKTKLIGSDSIDNNSFGKYVDIYGDYAIVSSYETGKAYIFKRQNDGNWIEKTILISSELESGYYHNIRNTINSDYAVVCLNNINIFERFTDEIWNEKYTILTNEIEANFPINSVYINSDYLIIGSPYYTFTKNRNLSPDEYIINSTIISKSETGGGCGTPIPVSPPGTGDDDIIYNDAGAVIVFEHQNDDTWIKKGILTSTDLQKYAYFGCSIALSGKYFIVGAYGTNRDGYKEAGTAYIYEILD